MECLPLFFQWLQSRVYSLEIRDQASWPANAIDLVTSVHKAILETGPQLLSGSTRVQIRKLRQLLTDLEDLEEIREKYKVKLKFSKLAGKSKLEVCSTILSMTQALELIPNTVHRVLKAYASKHCLILDQFLVDYIEELSYSSRAWICRSLAVLGTIGNSECRYDAICCILQAAPIPWPSELEGVLSEALSVPGPKAIKIGQLRDMCRFKVMLFSYNLKNNAFANEVDLDLLALHMLKCAPSSLLSDLQSLQNVYPDFRVKYYIRKHVFDQAFLGKTEVLKRLSVDDLEGCVMYLLNYSIALLQKGIGNNLPLVESCIIAIKLLQSLPVYISDANTLFDHRNRLKNLCQLYKEFGIDHLSFEDLKCSSRVHSVFQQKIQTFVISKLNWVQLVRCGKLLGISREDVACHAISGLLDSRQTSRALKFVFEVDDVRQILRTTKHYSPDVFGILADKFREFICFDKQILNEADVILSARVGFVEECLKRCHNCPIYTNFTHNRGILLDSESIIKAIPNILNDGTSAVGTLVEDLYTNSQLLLNIKLRSVQLQSKLSQVDSEHIYKLEYLANSDFIPEILRFGRSIDIMEHFIMTAMMSLLTTRLLSIDLRLLERSSLLSSVNESLGPLNVMLVYDVALLVSDDQWQVEIDANKQLSLNNSESSMMIKWITKIVKQGASVSHVLRLCHTKALCEDFYLQLMFETCLQETPLPYEKLNCIVLSMKNKDAFTIFLQQLILRIDSTDYEKLNFIISLQHDNQVNESKMTLISLLQHNDCAEESLSSLSFHALQEGDGLKMVTNYLSLETADDWAPLAHILRTSSNSIYLLAINQSVKKRLKLWKDEEWRVTDGKFIEKLLEIFRKINSEKLQLRCIGWLCTVLPRGANKVYILRESIELMKVYSIENVSQAVDRIRSELSVLETHQILKLAGLECKVDYSPMQLIEDLYNTHPSLASLHEVAEKIAMIHGVDLDHLRYNIAKNQLHSTNCDLDILSAVLRPDIDGAINFLWKHSSPKSLLKIRTVYCSLLCLFNLATDQEIGEVTQKSAAWLSQYFVSVQQVAELEAFNMNISVESLQKCNKSSLIKSLLQKNVTKDDQFTLLAGKLSTHFQVGDRNIWEKLLTCAAGENLRAVLQLSRSVKHLWTEDFSVQAWQRALNSAPSLALVTSCPAILLLNFSKAIHNLIEDGEFAKAAYFVELTVNPTVYQNMFQSHAKMLISQLHSDNGDEMFAKRVYQRINRLKNNKSKLRSG